MGDVIYGPPYPNPNKTLVPPVEFPSEAAQEFLMSDYASTEVNEAVQAELTADNFYTFVTATTAQIDEPTVARAIHRFSTQADVEFIGPDIGDEFSKVVDRAEQSISAFIQSGDEAIKLAFVDQESYVIIAGIYNKNNMLALAKDLAAANPDGLSPSQVDMIYRYRISVKRLEEYRMTLLGEAIVQGREKIGARTWAGNLHEYGHVEQCIDPRELTDFSEADDDSGVLSIIVDGERITFRDTTNL